MKVVIKKDECIGCKKCVAHCPFNAIEFADKKAHINAEVCTTCGACIDACPVKAIVKEGVEKAEKKDFSEYKNICVVAEFFEGKIKNVSLELISTAKRLAGKRGCDVHVIAVGNNIKSNVSHLSKYGADKVYVIDNADLENYQTLVYNQIVTEVINRHKPEIVMFGATHVGRDLAPRVANRLMTGLTADCTQLDICDETGLILQTRPAFGGNIMATIMCPDHRPQMSTVRPGVFPAETVENPGEIEIVEINDIDYTSQKDAVKILEKVKEIKHTVNLEDAKIIISGGRGMGSKDNFNKLFELADKIGGEVGASRAAIEDGWAENERQVGQTGKNVRPDLYVALGISGAIQHAAGMENSKYIIAVNKDHAAPIFKVADLGIVADVNKILPVLMEELPKLMEKGSEL